MEEKLIPLRKKYRQLAEKLAAPKGFHHFFEEAQHDGNRHVEMDGDEYIYLTTERGLRFDERRTKDESEILYWLVADLTWAMAVGYEFTNRVEGQDFRRILFTKDIELMESIDQSWAQRKRDHYTKILKEHPYDDG